MKTYEEIKKEMDEYKEEIKKLKAELHEAKIGSKDRWEKEKELATNYLQLFGGLGKGIRIPLDKQIKESITEHIKKEMYSIMRADKDFEEVFIKMAMNYKNAFIRIFKPIVQEMIEDLDLNVSFNR